jgi:hypothetical protein
LLKFKTDWDQDSFVHIPLKLVIQSWHKIDPEGDIWWFVREATGQPARML